MASSASASLAAGDDDDDASTFRGDGDRPTGDDYEQEEHEDGEPETQKVDDNQEEVSQFIMLHRLRGPGKELHDITVRVPYDVGKHGSANPFVVGRLGDAMVKDEKRAPDRQLISRRHAKFVSKQSGMYVSNMGATGTLVDGRLLVDGEEALLKHGTVITLGRDNTAPGQMLPYGELMFRVAFPDGPGSIGLGRRSRAPRSQAAMEPQDYSGIEGVPGQEMARAVAAAAQRLLVGLGRAGTLNQVRAATGTALNELQSLASSASKQHKAERRAAGGYAPKGPAAGASASVQQQQQRVRADERRAKSFHSKKRPQGHIHNTADKRARLVELTGAIGKKKGKGKGRRAGKGGGRRA